MADTDRCLGHDLREPLRHGVDVVNPVVHKKDLPPAGHLPIDRMANQPVIKTRDPRLDRQSIGRRSGETGNVTDAEHRHMECAGDRCGCHRQHIDASAEGLQTLLDIHAKPLLLIDDQESEI